MALTRITKGVIKPNENYDTHNINSTGIVTAIGLDVNGNGDISGNLSVGGVLTYEDVTSIDSVGIITAQSDIHVGGGVSAVGVGTFSGLDINGDLDVDGQTSLDHTTIAGIVTFQSGSGLDLATHNRTAGMRIINNGNASSDGMYIGYGNANNGATRLFGGGLSSNPTVINSTGVSIPNDLDVDGHTNLDNVSVAGVTTMSGNLTISNTDPRIIFVDTNNNPDFTLHANGGEMQVENSGSGTQVKLESSGSTRLFGNVIANKDLDVDGHTNLDNVSISGVTTITSIGPSIHFTDTNHNSDYSIVVNSGQFRIRDESNSANRFYIASDGSNFLNGDVHLGENQFGTGSRTRVYSGGGTHVKNALMVTNPTASVTGRGAGVALCGIGQTNDYIGTLYVRRSALGDNRGTTYLEAKDDIIINTNAATSTVTAATFDTSGRLMVGTSAVGRSGAQNLTIGNTGDQGMTIRSGTSHEGNIYFSDGSSGGNEESRGILRFDHSDDSFQFYTASGNNFSQERVRITSSGKFLVGIHTTSEAYTWSPRARFAVEGSGDASSIHLGLRYGGGADPAIMMLRRGGSSAWHHHVGRIYTDYNPSIHFQTSFAAAPGAENFQTHMVMKHNHGVGIGTVSPSEKLHITVPGNQRQNMLRLQHIGQRNFYIQGQWGSTDIGGSNGILQYTDGGGIAFRSGATGDAGMIVSQANKVGIHTNNPSVNLHAFMANTTNASVSWGANCGQIFRNEGSELAFGLQNTNPYPFYIQARTSASSARQLTLNPAGGAVAVGTINSFGRTFQVKGSVGLLSPSQTGALDMSIDDAGNFELGAYHSSGGSITLKTAPAGAGNQTRLNINKDGQLTHTTNKSSQYTAKFVQAHADNPAWIEIDSPQDNNLRPSYIQFKNAGNDKWGIGQVYNPTAGQSFHICEGTQSNSNSHFVIKSNNYVGINTNNPQSALHVRGAGGIRIDTLSGIPIASNSNMITDGGGNPIISGTPWFTTDTFAWQGSYSGMGYHWIKVVKSLGSSALGYIDYMAHGDSNYPRHCRGTIAIAKYSNGSISCCHDQQTHEGAGSIQLVVCSDGTVWIRLHAYDWNSDFRFRLVYGESVTLNTDFSITGSSDNSYGRIDTRGGGGPVGASPVIVPGANQRYSVSGNSFNPSGSNASYGNDAHRFFRIDCENQLTKGSGSFRIDHPLAGMSTSHYLQHSFVEGPQADNIYRGKTTLVAGISTVNIDTVSNMTDGTFVKLNTDVQCFTTNETGWTPIKGTVSGNKLTILAQDNSCTDTISWMVVGERQDDHIKNKADWTDSDGKVIVELPKPNVGFAGTEAPYAEFK